MAVDEYRSVRWHDCSLYYPADAFNHWCCLFDTLFTIVNAWHYGVSEVCFGFVVSTWVLGRAFGAAGDAFWSGSGCGVAGVAFLAGVFVPAMRVPHFDH